MNCLPSDNSEFLGLTPRNLKELRAKTANFGPSSTPTSTLESMKLRSKTETPIGNSSTVTATVPVLPPDITRLQTPPISELSNAGSTIARKDRLSELSSSIIDISDPEDTIDSESPTKKRHRPTVTVPAAPLTKKNLEQHQEEITSAVEIVSEEEQSPPPPTPNTRLTQARNYLLTEDINTDPEFESRYLQIAGYLNNHRHGKGRKEVLQLLEYRNPHGAGSKQPTPHRSLTKLKDSSGAVMSLPAEDHQGPQEQAYPFYWNNKLDDLTVRVRQHPSDGKEAFALSELRELARPLNGGRLPSPQEAYHLINAQMIKENHENKTPNEINHEQLWVFERNLPPASKEKKFSLDRWSGHPAEGSRVPAFKLGEGSLMPQEMMDIDWDRDRSKLEESLQRYEDVDRGDAQLLLAETPLLQALMSEQIESDLAPRVEKGSVLEPVPVRKPAVLMTRKFALPRPEKSKIDEAAKIAKSLNIQPDPPTPSPRTALFLKRKFEQCSDSETDGEEEEDRHPEPPIGGTRDVQGQWVHVDEEIVAQDSQFDASVGAYPEMSGALQDHEGEDDLHLYSDD